MDYTLWLPLAIVLPVLLYFYVRANDAKLTRLPPEATAFSPRRWTVEDLERTAASPAIAGSSPSLFSPEELPPKTGRRYIVIGGVSVHVHPSYSAGALRNPVCLHAPPLPPMMFLRC